MKKAMVVLMALVFLFSFIGVVLAKDIRVRGYYRKDGTYVQPHYRTVPNKSVWDNYSTKGNINPYTGEEGSKDPYNLYKPSRKNYNNTFDTNPYSPKRLYNPYDNDNDQDSDD